MTARKPPAPLDPADMAVMCLWASGGRTAKRAELTQHQEDALVYDSHHAARHPEWLAIVRAAVAKHTEGAS